MSPIVHFCLTDNREDASIFREHELPFSQFVSMFSQHLITEDKNSKMFVPWAFHDRWGRRNEYNTMGASMICLDFDDDSGWTVKEAKKVFAQYEHFGYTSHGHQQNGNDRFRIVLPLTEFAAKEEIEKRRRSLYKKYEGVDPSCLSISRAFYVPSCPESRKHLAHSWVNHGVLFDLTEFEREPDLVATTDVQHTRLSDHKREWIIQSLKETFIGREPTWRLIGLAMCAEGFTYQDFVYVSVAGLMNQKTEGDCRAKWQSIERTVARGQAKANFGTIINLLREHGKIYEPPPAHEPSDQSIRDFIKAKPVVVRSKPESDPILTADDIAAIKHRAFAKHSDRLAQQIVDAHVAARSDEQLGALLMDIHLSEATIKRMRTDFRKRHKAYLARKENERFAKVVGINEPEIAFDRDRRQKLTERLCVNVNYQRMLMFAFEGYGKSYYAVMEAKRGNKVVFASLSNKQVQEQYDTFSRSPAKVRFQKTSDGRMRFVDDDDHPYGFEKVDDPAPVQERELRYQMIPGREHYLRTLYGIEAVKGDENHPFGYGMVDETATKALIKEKLNLNTKEEVEAVWDECGADEPDFENHDIIFTTFARLAAWGKMQTDKATNENGVLNLTFFPRSEYIVPPNTIVFYDDPQDFMVNPLKPYAEKYEHLVWKPVEDAGAVLTEVKADNDGKKPVPMYLDIKEIKGKDGRVRKYFIRPDQLKLGFGLFKTKQVFTTTEHITGELIKKLYPDIYVPELMPSGPMKAGDITMIKTKLTRRDYHGLLLPFVNRIRKKHHDVEFIGDGVGSEYNMVNTKGMNSLADQHTIIKCSFPSPFKLIPVLDALELPDIQQNRLDVSKIIALDALQQAIGRNCGYRATDKTDPSQMKKCFVLCDPKLFKSFTGRGQVMRYYVEHVVNEPERVAPREYEQCSTLTDAVLWFVARYHDYLATGIGRRGQAFADDHDEVAKTRKGIQKKQYKVALLTAMRTVMGETAGTLKIKIGKWFDRWGGDLILKNEPDPEAEPTS